MFLFCKKSSMPDSWTEDNNKEILFYYMPYTITWYPNIHSQVKDILLWNTGIYLGHQPNHPPPHPSSLKKNPQMWWSRYLIIIIKRKQSQQSLGPKIMGLSMDTQWTSQDCSHVFYSTILSDLKSYSLSPP